MEENKKKELLEEELDTVEGGLSLGGFAGVRKTVMRGTAPDPINLLQVGKAQDPQLAVMRTVTGVHEKKSSGTVIRKNEGTFEGELI